MRTLKDKLLNNYDPIAHYYDALSRLVFHKAQVNAQVHQLSHIPAGAKILIAGGGTGWILDELSKIRLQNLSITYVEISNEMISLAKKRNIADHRVEFVNCAIEDFVPKEDFDVVHTAFLFDNFALERIERAFKQLNTFLKPGGLWLFTDFSYQPGKDKKWKGILLKMMYGFFQKITHTEARELTDTASYFEQACYEKLIVKEYYGKFIKAVIYKKRVKS